MFVYAERLEVALVSIIPPEVCAALIARDTLLAGILLVEEFDTALDAFSVGVVSVAAIDYTANAFLSVDSTVALVYQCYEELRIACATLLSPTFVREWEESDVLLCLDACELDRKSVV